MRAVAIHDFQNDLPRYLRLVKSGETVLVTERSEVVAQLQPPPPRSNPTVDLERRFGELAAKGEITRASLPKGDWTWRVRGLGLPPGTAAAILDEVRADR
ncbi:MAG: hypothetical protein GY856_47510 [bacterium]|nr:hypothetical protein [bacterium]